MFGFGSYGKNYGLGQSSYGTTPFVPVGNVVTPASWAAFKTALAAGNGAGGYVAYNVVDLHSLGGGAPDDIVFDNTYPAPGIIVIGDPLRPVRATFTSKAHNVRLVGRWLFNSDAVQGTIGNGSTSPNYYGVTATNASNVIIEGAVFDGNANGFASLGLDSITVRNCLFSRYRDNGLFISTYYGTMTKLLVQGNKFRESMFYPQTWYFLDGTNPAFNINPGGSPQYIDPNHIDAIQFTIDTNGPLTDANFESNDISARGQGIWLTDGSNLRVRVAYNSVAISGSRHLLLDSVSEGTIIGNAFTWFSDVQTGVTSSTIETYSNGGTGKIWGGLNTVVSGITQNVGGYAIDLLSGTLNGTLAITPAAPAFSSFAPNVIDLSPYTSVPTHTAKTVVAPYMDSKPQTYKGGNTPTTTTTIGQWLFGASPLVDKYSFGLENSYWMRWRCVTTNTIVKAAAQGPSGMIYQTGNIPDVRPEWSADNATYYNGPTVTVTDYAAGTTLNPSDKAADITLSNGNLTATRDATNSPAHRLVRTIGKIEQADGDYVFNFTPSNGSNNLVALLSSDWVLTNDPTDFGAGKAFGMFGSGAYYTTAGVNGNFGITDAINGTNSFTMVIRRSGSGTVTKGYLKGPSGWYVGGDPYAGTPGAGEDLSANFSGRDIYPAAWLYTSGQSVTFDFVAPYSPAPGGSPSDV